MTAAPPPPAPVYRRPEKVRDDEVRARPGLLTDTAFFLVATLAAGRLALVLAEDSGRRGPWHLALLVPFWALVAYLVLPRIHTMLAALYVPPYFIGRSRTSDGLLGDPVNLALDGTARQIHTAMTRAGWVLADDVTVRSSWAIIVSSVFKRSYPEAPVSPLLLFGRTQCLAYQQEVEGNAAQRHHVRLWRCPDGWLLPGGHRVQWLGGGTYDRSVGLSLFTLQITHKIDADIDIERDYIVASLRHFTPEVGVRVLKDFSTGYHHRNGGGDLIRTDGDLPILDCTAVPDDTALPPAVLRAARGYPTATPEAGSCAPDPDLPDADRSTTPGVPRPLWITVACAFTLALAALALTTLGLDHDAIARDALREVSDGQGGPYAAVVIAVLAAAYVTMALLAVSTYLGLARPRVWLMAVTTAAMITDEVLRAQAAQNHGWSVGDHVDLAGALLILLCLTAPSASTWSRLGRAARTGRPVDETRRRDGPEVS